MPAWPYSGKAFGLTLLAGIVGVIALIVVLMALLPEPYWSRSYLVGLAAVACGCAAVATLLISFDLILVGDEKRASAGADPMRHRWRRIWIWTAAVTVVVAVLTGARAWQVDADSAHAAPVLAATQG